MSYATDQFQDMAYWALCSNPDSYEIAQAVQNLKIDWWHTKRGNPSCGDRVIIWQAKGSGKNRGVIAIGEVVGQAEYRNDTDNPYWRDQEAAAQPGLRVPVQYHLLPGLPLWIGGKADSLLKELTVSRGQGTLFRVTEDQWDRVIKAAGG